MLKSIPKLRRQRTVLTAEDGSLPKFKSNFSYAWLRDNCQCAQCVHPSTKQKLHSSGKGFYNPRAKSCIAEEGSVKIEWDENHTSVYTIDWLKKYSYTFVYQPLIKHVLWDSAYYQSNHEKVHYKDFFENEGYQKILNQVKKYGLGFIDNVPGGNEKIVEEIAAKFGVIRVTYYLKSRIASMVKAGM
jgi:hypothetical protein